MTAPRIVAQGEGGSTSSPWYVRLVDGVGAALQVATETTLGLLNGKFPSAVAPAVRITEPTTTTVKGILFAQNPSQPTFVDRLETDPAGTGLKVTAAFQAPTSVRNATALEETCVVAGSQRCFHITGWVDAAGYILVFNRNTLPTGGEAPVGGLIRKVAAEQHFDFDMTILGLSFSNGVALAFSSTPTTFTAGGAHMRSTIQSR
jgi:hypothetical protein